MALKSAYEQDQEYALAYVLIAETSTNIINACVRTKAAADSLDVEVDKMRNAQKESE